MRRLHPFLIALLALALLPASALASRSQESMFQDDNQLVYATPSHVAKTMRRLKALGADSLRISVFWQIVAPTPDSTQRPSFDAKDPAAYPPHAWDRYDTIVRDAAARGLRVNFDVTSPAPAWATGTPPKDRPDLKKTWKPSPVEYRYFLDALGTRYSGSYTPAGASTPLPRVSYWSLWNEPDQPGWLTPQWGAVDSTRKDSALVPRAPGIYRDLVDAGYAALSETGHGKDTILIGELAPKGVNPPLNAEDKPETRQLSPLRFVRELYCVDRDLQPYTGTGAVVRGCPPDPREFVKDHPGLFRTSGFAHHPYALLEKPTQRSDHRDDVPLADLPKLERTLRAIKRRYGQGHGSVPIYLTEYGYQTRPPDPYQWTWQKQAKFLNEAEYMTSRWRYVRTLCQFLLVDDKPNAAFASTDPNYWETFQSGLMTAQGKRKRSYGGYRLPIWLGDRSKPRGQSFRIWGLLRSAKNGTRQTAAIQWRPRHSRRWRTVARVRTHNGHGYLRRRVRLRRSGRVRIAYQAPGAKRAIHSRSVAVRVRPRR